MAPPRQGRTLESAPLQESVPLELPRTREASVRLKGSLKVPPPQQGRVHPRGRVKMAVSPAHQSSTSPVAYHNTSNTVLVAVISPKNKVFQATPDRKSVV